MHQRRYAILREIFTRRATRNAASSYFAVASTAICGIISIPLAVHFLGKEELGLWALVSTVISYLLFMDFGVGDATGRKIADAVAHKDAEEVNRWWTATRFVLILQGLVVAILGLLFLPFFLVIFKIGPALQHEATILYCGAVVLNAASFPIKGISGLLMAQQRFHWVPLLQGIMPGVQLAVFALFLNLGWGLRAYLPSMAATLTLAWIYYSVLVKKSPLVPRWVSVGISWSRFRSLFDFSLKLNAIQIVEAILTSLPAILLGRIGGLAAVPVYTFTAKIPLLLVGIVRRTYYAFYPGLLYLYVTRNTGNFEAKFRVVFHLVLACGFLTAGWIVAFNRTIIAALAGEGFYAGTHTSTWLALGLIVGPASGTLCALFTIAGNLAKTPHMAAAKIVAGIGAAWPAYHFFGMAGLAALFTLLPIPVGIYAYVHGPRKCGIRGSAIIPRPLLHLAGPFVLVLASGLWIAASDPGGSSITIAGRLIDLPSWQEWTVAATVTIISAFWALNLLRELQSPRPAATAPPLEAV